jgi:hypothetical protein
MSKKLISTYHTEFQQNRQSFAIIDDAFRAGKPIMISGEMIEEAFNNATPEDREKFKRLISFDLEGEKITITPSTSKQTIEPGEHKNGITEVVVNPVTSAIDANIAPENIKKDVSILGVTGIVEEGCPPEVSNETLIFESHAAVNGGVLEV